MSSGWCRARAHANIALIKYWGKSDERRNLPAVPSLSLTLNGLSTTTRVHFDPQRTADTLRLDGRRGEPRELQRVSQLLNQVRRASGVRAYASVDSANDFPTASGLASSASGFAALALASLVAAGLEASPKEVSALARASSVSAARSAWGGFVSMRASAEHAEPLSAPRITQDARLLVAVNTNAAKEISSTRGMLQTQRTSPYYDAWCRESSGLHERARRALMDDDLEALGAEMERSTLMMHASMLAADPPVIYCNGVTLETMACVRELRRQGTLAHFTMDAGPHVKVLTSAAEADEVRRVLACVPGVQRVIDCEAGPAAHVVECA